MATFQRFEQCFGPLVQSLNISLSKVYKEICGEKKKYITFRRLISSYLKYKNTPRNTSIDFKKFFSFVFNNLIKSEKDYIGTKLKKSSKYSTANCKKKKAISKLTVLSNSKAEIRGFQIVYDDFFKNELYSKHETRLYVSLELGLNMLTQSTQSKQQHKLFPASHRRDAISHVFGTFDNTLTFVGFKCRSGKTVHVGKPKGDAFLFGVPGSVFHYMKVEVLDGVTCLQPFFAERKRSNPLMRIGLDKITEQYLVHEDHPIYEETVMHKINDPDKLDKVIMHQFVNDMFYYDDKHNDRIKGNSCFDLFQLEKRYWQAEMANKKNTPVSYDNLVKEAAEYAKRKRNSTNTNVNAVDDDNDDDVNNNTNIEMIIPKKGDKRPWRPVHPNSNYYNEDEQHEEDVNINDNSNNTTTTWDGVSIKNTNPRMFLFNYDNYLKLCERLESSIAYEINKRNKATSNALSSDADTNFYDKYLMNYLGFEHKKNILTGIYGEHVLDSQSPAPNEHDYNNQLINIKNRFLNNHHIKNISNDYFLDASPSSFTEPSETKAEKTKLAQLNWFKHCNRLSRSSGLFILRTIAAVIRTLQSLHKMEDNFIDKSLPLQDKIKIYEILTANKHIIKFLTKAHSTPKASLNVLHDNEQTATNDDNKCNNNIDTSAYETNDNEQLKTNDLNDINNKIAYIENLIKTKPNLFPNISDYYEYLKRKRNKIVNALNEEQTDIYINELNYNPEQALRDEEAERQRQIDAEEAAIALEEEQERNAVHNKVSVISIKNMEIPPNTEIYKYQTMCEPGVTWTDEYFKPETCNLCPINNNGSWALPEDIYPEDINGWEDIHWQRVETIFNSADFQVFFEGVNNDDIIQGGLGDCYFLSAIAALCKFPTLIKKLFYFKEKSQEHCYGVYLRINGKWELVLVDDYIPCYGDNVHYAMNFAFSSTNGNELWVILLEKAWAKINGNYAKIIGGEPHEVFDVITDAYSEKINVASAVANELWEKMLEGETKGFIMTAGTSGDTYNLDIEDVGLVPGHAYTVLGVREVNVNGITNKVVHVRNPWGNGEWSGEWSDSSDVWNERLRKELGVDGEVDDGEFYMSFRDFIKYFVVLGVCRLYADYTSTLLRYEPEEVQLGCKITCVDVTVDDTNVYLMLHQKNPRIVLKNGTYQKPVIAYLCLMDSNYNYITASTNTEMNLCIYTTLNKGKYYLISDIAYRFVQPEQMHGYNLTTYASNPVGLTALTNVNAVDALRKCLFSYAKTHITPLVDLGGNIYRSKRYCKEFPFAFAVFENRSNSAITITDVLSYRGVKSVCFYEEGNNEHARSLQKTIKAKEYDVFIHMPYTMSSMFEYALTSDVKADESEMEEIVFNETGQSIDDKGYIKEYVHEIGGGYLIGIENKGTCKEYLKIVMEGLYEVNAPNESEVPFMLMGKSRKVFNLKLKDNYKGDISYMFDYA